MIDLKVLKLAGTKFVFDTNQKLALVVRSVCLAVCVNRQNRIEIGNFNSPGRVSA